ncbi:MAG: hypothetical protein A3C70_01590 [Candidatus Zambryskibacteria bacterium RIFCSPHIGHO2_02_FULL_43_14]|uniref:Uncharacterized protein n=1 Tax=Candidatus Zambryskibacteria bacterium RIFCSPHIGHO2_02_FULL_43_14 TaxID=1802748 RepID=A0A1G2TGN0_9BACT|nr:MAG: hypothetical protein A2829_03485 [Candidatus Zambryskibacteria bacterium RIFCSPHIGHO2_01_FULL_43_60]OHA96198.1 MAG: hypothetical protein A3C70_01590 [Candidatus Zambryskibacteria bacterium RIFCSPHIGHO2_02_FULL_43_14]OHB03849.1 MAG: hypothetical protein A3B03_03590 [Candidatus Zambryskibacteria bacterium RIFCSPLOWO2_01_FULL_42_41]
MSQIKSNQFLELALGEIPRFLGQLNRNQSSRSYGSFDRAYWHYRTNDISSARYQEAVYTLTLLYFSNFEGNIYYQDEKVLEWIRAGLRFTAGLQKSNGSFDEWYINEGSYVATAFVTAALSQTHKLFKENRVEFEEEYIISNTIEKAVLFLLNTDEETVLNQVSGAIFAIASANKNVDLLLSKFLEKQESEGWWSEYGGPDIGYLTLTISYLSKYKALTGSKKVDEPIERAKSFVRLFINPDHTAGGEYMSRNTEYIIPSPALPYLCAIKPSHLDDRYLCYILYNWIETGLQITPQMTTPSLGENYFPESSLLRVVNEHYFLVANGKKGGSFRLYAGDKVYYDSGLEIKTSKGNCSAGILDRENSVSFKKGCLRVTGAMKKIREPLLETKTAIAFKLWQLTFGRFSFLQKAVKKFLRPRMISYSSGFGPLFERTIEYGPQIVIITDIICGAVSQDDILIGVKAAYIAVPSSKYAPIPEIASRWLKPSLEKKEEANAYIIKRKFSFDA